MSYSDAIFKQAIMLHSVAESEQWMAEACGERMLSPASLSKKINSIVEQESRKTGRVLFLKKAYARLSKVAVFVLMILLVLSLTVGSVSAVRQWILRLVVESNQEAVRYYLAGDEIPVAVAVQAEHKLLYLPQTMKLLAYDKVGSVELFNYQNSEHNFIKLQILNSNSQLLVKTKSVGAAKKININNNDAFITESEGVIDIVWTASDFLFYLSTDLDLAESVKIAEGIR